MMEGCLVSDIHEEVMTRFPSVIVEFSLQSKRYFSLGITLDVVVEFAPTHILQFAGEHELQYLPI
jgi:hypothetical protein